MSLVPMAHILYGAGTGKYGTGAYNVNNLEQIQGIMQAARRTQSPVIIQASFNAVKYAGLVFLKHLMQAAAEEYPEIPIAMHLDHGPDLGRCRTCIDLGFTSVMIDGSLDYGVEGKKKPPRPYGDNVRITKDVVQMAHECGVTVEGELGTLGGIEDQAATTEVKLTDPDQAVDFVGSTGVDALAVAIGTSHGAYKFRTEPKIDLDRVVEIRYKLDSAGFPYVALVMHGASEVPGDLVATVNQYGGRLERTMGVPMPMKQQAIRNGIQKVNIDTDGRLAVTAAVRKHLRDYPEHFDPREYMGPARDAIEGWVATCMGPEGFGTAGHASDFDWVSTQDMTEVYRSPDVGARMKELFESRRRK